MNTPNQKPTAAVIGGGISGICAAYLLQRDFKVTLFEKGAYLGGHTNTIVLENGPDRGTAVDTGFIVLNDKTYPNLHRLLAAWGVEVRFSDMSFGYHSQASGLSYSGRGMNGLFAQRINLLRPSYYSFLLEIRRFCRQALSDLENEKIGQRALGEYLDAHEFSNALREYYVLPMGAAIWSSPAEQLLLFPAETFIRFFKNHGLLSLKDRPRWQTVLGGSHQYVRAFQKCFNGEIKLATPVQAIRRDNGKTVIKTDAGGTLSFDLVVMAVHADQVLGILEDASESERRNFGCWEYQLNRAILHSDESLMPPNKRAWASWNYIRTATSSRGPELLVTYHMNRLQGLSTASQYFVTLNGEHVVNKSKIIKVIDYHHPVFTLDSIASRQRIAANNGQSGIWYCGSYFGYGFHEDGVNSAFAVAQALDITL